jgi:hypothetical protein
MTILGDLTAAGNSEIIPGHMLSVPRLLEWAEAEQEAQRQYLWAVADAASALSAPARETMYSRAVDNLKSSPFAFGSAAFDAWATSAGALAFLLWLSLRIKRSRMTRAQAAELLLQHDARRIMPAVLDLWGYRLQKKASNRPPAVTAAVSTGEASSAASSENATAATNKPGG